MGRFLLTVLGQSTQGSEPSALLLIIGLALLASGVYALRTAILRLQGDARGWMGGSAGNRSFPRTVSLGAWAWAFVFIVGGIYAVVAYLGG